MLNQSGDKQLARAVQGNGTAAVAPTEERMEVDSDSETEIVYTNGAAAKASPAAANGSSSTGRGSDVASNNSSTANENVERILKKMAKVELSGI